HSGKPGCVARLQCRLTCYVEQSGQRARARLCRRNQAAARRNHPDDGAERAQGSDEPAATESCMSMFRLFSSRPTAPATAPIARERLQILLAHERGMRGEQPDLLMLLREAILAAVARHVALDPDKVMVRMERGKNVSTLEVDVELPNGLEPALAVAS